MIYTIKPNTTKEELIEKGFVDYTEEEYAGMLQPYSIDTDETNYTYLSSIGKAINCLACVTYLNDDYNDNYANDYYITKIEKRAGLVFFFAEYVDKRRNGRLTETVPCYTWLLAERCMLL